MFATILAMAARLRVAQITATGVLLLQSSASWGGDFVVSPIRMELGAGVKTGVFTVRNDGKDKLSFQLRGMDWTQDKDGKDQYANATDLVYFPRILSIEAGQEAVIRVGVRQSVVPVEKTYRLFIEELPLPAAADVPKVPGQTAVTVLIQFGAPIFVRPVQTINKLDIEQLHLSRGEVQLQVRNSGNQHQLIENIQLKGLNSKGESVYAMKLADRYLLAGTVRRYSASIPQQECGAVATLVVEIKTDKTESARKIDKIGDTACH